MTKYFLLVLSVFILCLSSCIKKQNAEPVSAKTQISPPPPRPIIPEFHFKVNGGSPVFIDSVDAGMGYSYSSIFPNGTRFISINAYKNNLMVLQFSFLPTNDSQSVALNKSQYASIVYITEGPEIGQTNVLSSISGYITLTTCDTINGKLEGTFNFTAAVLDGTFSNPTPSNSIPQTTITEGKLYVTKWNEK